jgi:hypothetical protein
MRRRRNPTPAGLKGQKWRNTHQSTVDAILGAGVRSISSRGNQFYNKDNWTARTFAGAFTSWAKLNPGARPTYSDIEGFVVYANRSRVDEWEKGITIAATPDDLPQHLAMALLGGGYHEAWHTKWSRVRHLSMSEVWPRIIELWDLIPYEPAAGKRGWAGLTGPLLEWSNIIEDIRIERLGCKMYPGAPEKMEALQDLILKMEVEGRAAAVHRKLPINDDLAVVMGSFRDLGLGYGTPQQKVALQSYRERSPAGWLFVNAGPLRPLLNKAIALGPDDDLESLWLAMEVVSTISAVSVPQPRPAPPKKPEPKEEEEDEQDEDLDEDEQDSDEQGEEGDEGEEGEPSEDEDEDGDEGDSSDEEDASASEEEAPPSSGSGGSAGPDPDALLWKLGDRAVLKAGPYAGREVEVIKAGLPDENGKQDLSYALVEED